MTPLLKNCVQDEDAIYSLNRDNKFEIEICKKDNHEKLKSKEEDIVSRVLELERKVLEEHQAYIESQNNKRKFIKIRCQKPDNLTDQEIADRKKNYLSIEAYLSQIHPSQFSWQVAGPLNYTMSIEKMKLTIENKFREMASIGTLMRESYFNEKHDRSSFYPIESKGDTNLTRIWGAEFLKSHIADGGNLNVADHFLIIKDSEKEIEVEVSYLEYPTIEKINNGYVLSKKNRRKEGCLGLHKFRAFG